MGANREAWRSDLVSTLGRQRKIDEQKDGDCITVLWAEQYYGRSCVMDSLAALELHQDCKKLLAEAESRRPGPSAAFTSRAVHASAKRYLDAIADTVRGDGFAVRAHLKT
jgi:hypothetical protein